MRLRHALPLILLFGLTGCPKKTATSSGSSAITTGNGGNGKPSGNGGSGTSRPELAAGDFLLGKLDGSDTRLSDHRAKVTVIAMWATYCAPCLRELPLLERLHRNYRDNKDVEVILVSVDDFEPEFRDKVRSIVTENGVTMPALFDRDRRLFERLAPRDANGKVHYTIPMLTVIDRDFAIRRKLELARDVGAAAFISEIAPLIESALRGEKAPPEEPYVPALGGALSQRFITLTVSKLGEQQAAAYLKSFRARLEQMYPDLHGHEIDDVLAEIEPKLRIGGTFKISIPFGHGGAH